MVQGKQSTADKERQLKEELRAIGQQVADEVDGEIALDLDIRYPFYDSMALLLLALREGGVSAATRERLWRLLEALLDPIFINGVEETGFEDYWNNAQTWAEGITDYDIDLR